MMGSKRCFENPFSDYPVGSDVVISKEQWHDKIEAIVKQIVDSVDTCSPNGGLYLGSSGIAYMLYYLSKYEPFAGHRSSYLDTAQQILKKNIEFAAKTKSASNAVSFILGPAGIYALGTFLGKICNNETLVEENLEKYQSLAEHCTELKFLTSGSDELFVGRAGYLCGMLAIEKCLGIKVLNTERINAICNAIVQSGEEYAKEHSSPSALMYEYYTAECIGAAHGISAILQAVLCCPSYLTSNPQGASLVKQSVDWLLTLQQKNGNFVMTLSELNEPRSEEEELVHWCHGAPGVVYLFAQAYKVWKEPQYLEACLQCGEITWSKGLLSKGPGLCHGVAGSGYVFLLLYRLTGDKKHLYRASKFAEFMFCEDFKSSARTPDHPNSLYEGWAGTVCFLVDLLQPDSAEFPFFSVV